MNWLYPLGLMVPYKNPTETPPTVAGPAPAPALVTDTKYKAAEFIETYTGAAFYPLAPKVEDVTIIDIAHHLAHQNRYSGATEFFYSTAQHCCLLTDYVRKECKGTPLDCLQILMHDCAEAYLVDVPRPIKQHMPEFRQWDLAITMCVRSWLGIGDVPIPKWQDELDSRIIMDERAQVLSDSGLEWKMDGVEPLGIPISWWSPITAEQQFLMRYASHSYALHGSHQYLRSAWGLPLDATYRAQKWRTLGSDVQQLGETDLSTITDLQEVDLRGGVGRVALRSPDGMMMRDTRAGSFPRPAWGWIRGKFELIAPETRATNIEVDTEAEGVLK